MHDLSQRLASLSPAKRRWLEQQLLTQRARPRPDGMVPRNQGGPARLSFAQERLWFLEQLEGQLVAYNMPLAWRLRGPLNTEALQRALEAIVRRHESLRTTFALEGDTPIQVVRPPRGFELPVYDLRTLPVDQREPEASRLCLEEVERHFDLAADVMLRASLWRLEHDLHVLLAIMHHVATDAWSKYILERELTLLYDAFCRGADPELSELPLQYVDFAVWQQAELQGLRLEKLLKYWREQLEGVAPLNLPTDRPRPPVPTYRGAQHAFELKGTLAERLKMLSRAESVTLHMTLLAAFQVLLARYSGQDDIAVGTPIAARNHPALEDLIGFFANTLVLRTDLSGDPTFRELLARVRQVSLAAYDHQDLPFEKLVADLRPERHLSRNPLVQVIFQLLNFSDKGLNLRDLEVSPLPPSSQRARLDLEVHLRQGKDAVDGIIIYSTDLFDAPTIERMVGHFHTLLEGIVANPNQRIGELPLLRAGERQQLVVEWNDTAGAYPRDECVHHLFEAQVERTPGPVAVVFAGQELTYRELNERANQLAHHLRELGVGPETLVALCLERSTELVVGILGILKAGGAYLPLDADYPPQRLQFMLRDAQVGFLVTQRRLLGRLPAAGCQVVCLDTDATQLQQRARSNPSLHVGPDSPAYVMFTSGSTGQPKGVVIRHTSIARLVFGNNYATFGPDRVFLQLAPVSFDASTFELWGALLHGARLVVAPPGLLDFRQLENLLKQNGVTTLWLTAALFNQLVDERPEALNSVEEILTGGEALSVRHICKAQRILGSRVRLINGYGPTESTTFATCYRIPSDIAPDLESIPIGRPMANTTTYVLDAQRQPVPIGVPGELYLGGPGLARGYLNRPELTREKFIANPFSADPDSRLYRTGDACRWRADGNLEFLGRLDNQVKLRGYRIELGEIEGVLKEHPQVQETVVVLHQDAAADDKTLVAYVVPRGQAPAFPHLRGFIQQKLPGYMIPAAFVLLERLPLTTNGKIDRRALPAPGQTRSSHATGYVAPRSALEEQLAATWAELLRLERVGIHDNFFEQGGHSLLAMQVTARVNSTLGVSLALRKMFETPTIAALAAEIQVQRAGGCDHAEIVTVPRDSWRGISRSLQQRKSRPDLGTDYVAPRTALEDRLAEIWADVLGLERVGIHDDFFELGGHSLMAMRVTARASSVLGVDLSIRRLFETPTIAALAADLEVQRAGGSARMGTCLPQVPRDKGPALPLSFAQQRLWFLEQLEEDEALYNMPSAWRIHGPLDVGSLRRALETIVQRHEPLRTVFSVQDGEPFQQILPPRAFELPRHDLRDMPAADREAEIVRRAHTEAVKPFDLAVDLPLRSQLFELSGDEHVLLLTQHHIASDGWSQQVLWRELETLYAAYGRGEPSPLPEMQYQYVEYALWQRERLQGERFQAQLDSWRKQLTGLQPLQLPTDRPRPSQPSFRGGRRAVLLEASLVRGLRELSRAAGATLQMTLLAAFQVLLQRYSGQDDVAVGVPVAGRLRPEWEPLIGFFVNMLVVRTDLSGPPTFRELLGRVRRASLEAYEHQEVPFEKLVEELKPQRQLSRHPLFAVTFQVSEFAQEELTLPGLAVTPLPRASAQVRFDLEVHLQMQPQGHVHGTVLYRTDLYDAAPMERLVGYFQTLLHGIVAEPDTPIDRLPRLTEIQLGSLPMNGHGKVDRRALPLPDAHRPELATAYVAPRNQVEEQLAAIWANVLRLERIGIHDNFFELGGHSLLAVRLLAAVERVFPVRLPLVTLFRHPTIAQLEGALHEPRPEITRPVLELLRSGQPDQTPLVVAPSLFGEVHEWQKVAELLPAGRAIYGLRVAGSEPYWTGCQSLQDVAQGFAAALRDTAWTGPCHLVGFSFGGILAFEVARQLSAAGGQVGSVVVVDTGFPHADGHWGTWLMRDLPSMVRNFPRWVWMNVVQSPRKFLHRVRLKARSRLARLGRLSESKGNGATWDPRLAGVFDFDRLPALYRERLSISWQLARQYRPGPYRGRLTLLRCRTHRLIHRGSPDLGWGRWVDGLVEIRDLPGSHDTVFLEPYIYTLTDSIHQIVSNEDATRRIRESRICHERP